MINTDFELKEIQVGEDENNINLYVKLKFPTLNSFLNDDMDNEINQLKACLESIFNEDGMIFPLDQVSDKDLVNFIQGIPMNKINEIKNSLEKKDIMSIKLNPTCRHCGKGDEYEAKTISDFFTL